MSDEIPAEMVEEMEEGAKEAVEDVGAADGGSPAGSEKENVDPAVNVGVVAVDGMEASLSRAQAGDGAVAGPSGLQAMRPNLMGDGGVSGVLDGIPEEKLIEICRGAVHWMGTLQRTEFAGHFSGVLANDANAFGPIIRVSGVVVL